MHEHAVVAGKETARSGHYPEEMSRLIHEGLVEWRQQAETADDGGLVEEASTSAGRVAGPVQRQQEEHGVKPARKTFQRQEEPVDE